MSNPETKSERILLRTTPSAKALLARAARSSKNTVTEFLLDAGLRAAHETLAERRVFGLDDARWQELQTTLDRSVAPKPRLRRLLVASSVLE